jgi:hypothetical protein
MVWMSTDGTDFSNCLHGLFQHEFMIKVFKLLKKQWFSQNFFTFHFLNSIYFLKHLKTFLLVYISFTRDFTVINTLHKLEFGHNLFFS